MAAESLQEMKRGSVPFAHLPDGRLIMANWVERILPPPEAGKWRFSGDEIVTDWSLSLGGVSFRIYDAKSQMWWNEPSDQICMKDSWKTEEMTPFETRTIENNRFEVRYTTYHANHYGSVKSNNQWVFDIERLECEYHVQHDIDLDD